MKNTLQKFRYVVLSAIRYVFEYKGTLIKALLIPFCLYVLLDLAEYLELTTTAKVIASILGWVAHTLFAVTTHRVVLLGPKSIPKWGTLSWSKRETLFALHILGLGIVVIPLAIFSLVPVIGVVLVICSVFWVIGRLSLVFPAIAIDQGVSYIYSWNITKNYQLLMVLVVIVFPILLLAPALLLSFIPYGFIGTSILSTFATVFTVAALSVTYKEVFQELNES